MPPFSASSPRPCRPAARLAPAADLRLSKRLLLGLLMGLLLGLAASTPAGAREEPPAPEAGLFARGEVRRVMLAPGAGGLGLRVELSRYCPTGCDLMALEPELPRAEVWIYQAVLALEAPLPAGLRVKESPRGVLLVWELERPARLRAREGYRWLPGGDGAVEYFLRLAPARP